MHRLGLRSWVVLFFVLACQGDVPEDSLSSKRSEVTATGQPRVEDFAVYADSSVLVRAGGNVQAGDLGARGRGAGSTLVSGQRVSLGLSAQVDTMKAVLGETVQLGSRATIGKVFANRLSNQGGTHDALAPFPTTMPRCRARARSLQEPQP